jgi:hypothetical protein
MISACHNAWAMRAQILELRMWAEEREEGAR